MPKQEFTKDDDIPSEDLSLDAVGEGTNKEVVVAEEVTGAMAERYIQKAIEKKIISSLKEQQVR
jgi:hypothetical protein